MVRYSKRQPLTQDNVISEEGLHRLFDDRNSKKQGFDWKSIYYVQACVKDAIGCGKTINYQFYAPLNEQIPERMINYLPESDEELPDVRLVESDEFEAYIYRQCLKIGNYLQKIRKIEVLQMKVEFTRDENKNIWFTHACDLHIRRLPDTKAISSFHPDRVTETMRKIKDWHRDCLIREAEEGGQASEPMSRALTQHYSDLKAQENVDSKGLTIKEDTDIERVLNEVRDNSKVGQYRNILSPRRALTMNKNAKELSRKIELQDPQRVLNQVQTRGTRFLLKRKSAGSSNNTGALLKRLDVLIGSLD